LRREREKILPLFETIIGRASNGKGTSKRWNKVGRYLLIFTIQESRPHFHAYPMVEPDSAVAVNDQQNVGLG
jgi:hypothetical protein